MTKQETKYIFPPGPEESFFGANASYSFYFKILDYLIDLHKKYGDAVHFKAMKHHMYLISDVDLVEKILVKHPDKFLKGTSVQRLKIILGTGLISSEGEVHDTHRKMMAPFFQKNSVSKYMNNVIVSIDDMFSKWDKKIAQGKHIEIHEESGDLFVEMILQSIFSDDCYEELITIGQYLNKLFYNASPLLLIAPDISLKLPIPESIRFKKIKKKFDAQLKKIIKERIQSHKRKEDLLDALIHAKTNSGYKMDEVAIYNEVITLYIAASDTSSKILAWTFYLLAKHHDIKEKVFEEINSLSEEIKYSDLDKLIYTRCLIAETLRLYPPVWAISRNPTEDLILNNYIFKKNSTVLLFPFIIHRDKRFYNEPLKCRPERWLNDERKLVAKYAYIPFGAGPRVCLGDNFAWMELLISIIKIMRHYDFKLAHQKEVELSSSITLKPKDGIFLKVHRKK
ncbi:MAG TPA: cytochrome P450 [Ignavibacteria bacterium]|nr:cytochrome P450 [Ignavibacteria bacterium]